MIESWARKEDVESILVLWSFLSNNLWKSSINWILRDNFATELKRQVISCLERWSVFKLSPWMSTLKAVPRPWVWILPQSLHFSHPTQSMMLLVMFRKCSPNSCWFTTGRFLNKLPSSRFHLKDLTALSKSLIASLVAVESPLDCQLTRFKRYGSILESALSSNRYKKYKFVM